MVHEPTLNSRSLPQAISDETVAFSLSEPVCPRVTVTPAPGANMSVMIPEVLGCTISGSFSSAAQPNVRFYESRMKYFSPKARHNPDKLCLMLTIDLAVSLRASGCPSTAVTWRRRSQLSGRPKSPERSERSQASGPNRLWPKGRRWGIDRAPVSCGRTVTSDHSRGTLASHITHQPTSAPKTTATVSYRRLECFFSSYCHGSGMIIGF